MAAIFFLAWIGGPGSLRGGPPKLDHFYPAGAARDSTVVVTAAGSFDQWPVKGWVDRAGLTIAAAEEKGRFQISVAADAVPGVYWLRVYDGSGASSPRPFVVGTLSEVLEQEPNDELAKAQALDGGATVNGRLEKSGDVDGFALEVAAGETLVASLAAHTTLGSPMDAVLQICDGRGFVVAQNDDDRGLDPQLAFTAPRDDRYVVRVFAFPAAPNSTIGFAGGGSFVYRLTVTAGPFGDHTLPLALQRGQSQDVQLFGWNVAAEGAAVAFADGGGRDQETATVFHAAWPTAFALPLVDHPSVVAAGGGQPQAVRLPVTISGRLAAAGDEHAFRFAAVKGDRLRFRAEADTLGFLLDPQLLLTAADGKLLAEVDDSNRQRDCELTQTIAADGEYTLTIRDTHGHGGFRYLYRLSATRVEPDFALTLDADAYVLTPGKPLEVTVSIDRRDGFKGEIEVTASDLPAGVTAQAVTSPPEGDAAKKVTLLLEAAAGAASGTFRVVGRGGPPAVRQHFARFTINGPNADATRAWLTVAP